MVGAVVGEVQVSLVVAGAVLGEVQVSLFVVGAVLGEVEVSLFVVGAVLGEVQYKMLVLSAKGNPVCAAGCELTGSFSERSRIMLGSAAHWK